MENKNKKDKKRYFHERTLVFNWPAWAVLSLFMCCYCGPIFHLDVLFFLFFLPLALCMLTVSDEDTLPIFPLKKSLEPQLFWESGQCFELSMSVVIVSWVCILFAFSKLVDGTALYLQPCICGYRRDILREREMCVKQMWSLLIRTILI